jgi:hypothetical protein
MQTTLISSTSCASLTSAAITSSAHVRVRRPGSVVMRWIASTRAGRSAVSVVWAPVTA